MEKSILDIVKEKGPGFTVPIDYFDSVEDTVVLNLGLNKLPKEEGFKLPELYFETIEDNVFSAVKKPSIPEGYFDTVEDRVFEKLKKEEPKVISLSDYFKKVMIPIAVAASILLVFMFTYTNDTAPQIIAEVDLDSFIEEDLVSLNTYEIAEVYDDTDIENFTLTEDIELTDDYLNGIDVESIMLEN